MKSNLNESDPNGPQVLTEVADEFEAAAVITALRELGIEATAVGGFTAGFIAEAPGYVKLMVRKCDLDDAQKALQKIEKLEGTVDWSGVDVGEPEDSE